MENSGAASLVVRPITDVLDGIADLWRLTSVASIWTVDIARFWPGGNRELYFLFSKGKPVRFAVFAAKFGSVERAFLLMTPQSGIPSSLLIVITHGFAQNDAYYNGLGYSNPLSLALIKDVTDRFLLGRWGAHLM